MGNATSVTTAAVAAIDRLRRIELAMIEPTIHLKDMYSES